MILNGVSDIRRFFHTNKTPIYFISATNFNLLGLDEWVNGLKFINYIDCFDGGHPNLFVPKETPHEVFSSIEDINNYLLEHKEVIDYIKARGPGKAIFLMFDAATEESCRELGLEVCFPSAQLRQEIDNKIGTTRIGNRAGVPSVPNALGKVASYAELLTLADGAGLGHDLVVQSAFGDSGHTTFFIANEADYKKHAEEIAREREVKVMKRIRCRQAAMEGCVTRRGTLVGPLMTEIVGFKELTPYKGGWAGNELFPSVMDAKVQARARQYTFQFGEEIGKMGYRGYFELDFLVDADTGDIYLGEVNPRITGASLMTNQAAFAFSDAPLFLFHLLEWMGVDYELDVDALNQRWARAENIDSWAQLILKHTDKEIDVVDGAPPSGLYRLEGDKPRFVRPALHRRAVENENDAFYLRITKQGDYRYEGADMGILTLRGRLMDDEFRLQDRARIWAAGMLGQYTAKAPEAAQPKKPAPPAKLGRFKIF